MTIVHYDMENEMGFQSRLPTSNEPPTAKSGTSPWLGETELMDEFALKLSGKVKSCSGCKRATHVKNIDSNKNCPDCR